MKVAGRHELFHNTTYMAGRVVTELGQLHQLCLTLCMRCTLSVFFICTYCWLSCLCLPLFAKLLPSMYARPVVTVHTYYMPLCHDLQPAVMPPQEELWKSLFSEPGMWYDKRPTVNNRPNFVHKQHHFSLWLNGAPEWVVKGVADADSAVEVLWEKVGILCWLH